MADMIDTIREEIRRATESAGQPPKQIKVTVVAVPGAIMDAPMLDKHGRPRPKKERQILIHPEDWLDVQAEAVRVGGNGHVLQLWGVPVITGEL